VPAGNSIYHAFSDDNAAACSIMWAYCCINVIIYWNNVHYLTKSCTLL
jgi:hypothetical protein